MAKKISVFISSKMQELRPEREALAALLPQLGDDNFRLEAWVFEQDALATDHSIREVFINALNQSDLYIGIFWNQYGEWTVDEFRRAGELGIPRHIYVKDIDTQARDPRLAKFLEKESDVRFGITPRWYQSIAQFQDLVQKSIQQWLADREIAYHSSTNALVVSLADDIPDLPRRLIGRKKLIKRVTKLLEEHEHVLLRGFGGMGKTAIAASIAADYLESGNGKVIWIRTGAVNADGIFDAIGRAFDQQQAVLAAEGAEREQVIRHILAAQNALLVLDDAWNGTALAQVLKAMPRRMPLLVTSRQRFPLDEVIEVNELDSTEALELLSYHARDDYEENPDAKKLCEVLGFHAFALEIAGKTLKVYALDPSELLQRIAEAPHDLTMPAGFGDLGRQGIKSLLDASIDALNRDLYETYVTMGGLLEATATAELVARAMQADVAPINAALEELTQRGLVNQREQNGVPFYHLHDLGYSYARQIFLSKNLSQSPILAAYRDYALAHANDLAELDVEYNAILEAAETALQHGEFDILIDVMRAFAIEGAYFAARGHTLRSIALMREAISRTIGRGDTLTAHYLLGKLGNAYSEFLGNLPEALNVYEKALELARDLGNRQREAILLTVIGTVRFRQREADSDSYHQQAETIAHEIGDDAVLCQILFNRGAQATDLTNSNPNHQLGRELSSQAAEIAERIGHHMIHFYALLNRGAAEHELGDYQRALTTHQAAYQVAESQKSYPLMAEALYSLGEDYHELKQADNARLHLNKALQLYRESGVQAKADTVLDYMKDKKYPVTN